MKIKTIITLAVTIISLFSCNNSNQNEKKTNKSQTNKNQNTKETNENQNIEAKDTAISKKHKISYLEELEKSDSLLLLFGTVKTDIILIKTVDSLFNSDKEWYIDYKYYKIFSDVYNRDFPLDDEKDLWFYRLYPIVKFRINDNILGLVILKWGMYTFSKKDLILYNIETKQMSFGMELSDSWGDAGTDYNKMSWIIDIDKDGFCDIISKDNIFIPITGPGPEGVVGHIIDSITVYRGSNGKFEKVLSTTTCDSAYSLNGIKYSIVSRLSDSKTTFDDRISEKFDIDLIKYQKYNDF